MKLIGKGLIIDLTSGLEFPDYGDMVLTLGLNVGLNVGSVSAGRLQRARA